MCGWFSDLSTRTSGALQVTGVIGSQRLGDNPAAPVGAPGVIDVDAVTFVQQFQNAHPGRELLLW
jgi:hypothetical protein